MRPETSKSPGGRSTRSGPTHGVSIFRIARGEPPIGPFRGYVEAASNQPSRTGEGPDHGMAGVGEVTIRPLDHRLPGIWSRAVLLLAESVRQATSRTRARCSSRPAGLGQQTRQALRWAKITSRPYRPQIRPFRML